MFFLEIVLFGMVVGNLVEFETLVDVGNLVKVGPVVPAAVVSIIRNLLCPLIEAFVVCHPAWLMGTVIVTGIVTG